MLVEEERSRSTVEKGRKGSRGQKETMEDEDLASEKRRENGGGSNRTKNTINHFDVTQFNGRTVGTYIHTSPVCPGVEDRLFKGWLAHAAQ